jgi:phospholipid/cholesterol/gamma-HCH transport system substrate-binding protein
VTNLAAFTGTLAENDALVRAFMKDLAGVSQTLATESDELQQAVAAVADAVGTVETFVRDNRDGLSKSIRQLTSVMSAIASEKDNLRSALEIAPTAMDSLHLGFDHTTGSQNSRVGIAGNIWTADGFICGLLQQAPGVPRALKDVACDLIAQLLSPIIDNLPPLPPGYEQYVPKPAVQKNGRVNVPIAPDMDYAPADDPSLTGLLGGGS